MLYVQTLNILYIFIVSTWKNQKNIKWINEWINVCIYPFLMLTMIVIWRWLIGQCYPYLNNAILSFETIYKENIGDNFSPLTEMMILFKLFEVLFWLKKKMIATIMIVVSRELSLSLSLSLCRFLSHASKRRIVFYEILLL